MTNETLRMQMLSGIITEGEYKAKLQENKKKKSLKESMIGGIVGIGAINQIPPRAKADYEMAFEHFLGNKYGLKENEEMITPKTLANYIMDMIELADDMEYTSEMVDELENLKNTLSDRSMSKEEALKIMQKTIDITGDEIDAAEALNQAISGDYKLNERETKFENREQDPHTMNEEEEEEEDYGTNIVTGKKLPKPDPIVEEEVNEGKLDGLYMELKDVLFPYYTDLVGKERVSMIDDVIKELNSYILILQDEKKAKQ